MWYGTMLYDAICNSAMRICITYTYTYRHNTTQYKIEYTVSHIYEQKQKRLSNNHFLFLGEKKSYLYIFWAEKFINIHKV